MIEYIKTLIERLPDGGQNDTTTNDNDDDGTQTGTNDGGYIYI